MKKNQMYFPVLFIVLMMLIAACGGDKNSKNNCDEQVKASTDKINALTKEIDSIKTLTNPNTDEPAHVIRPNMAIRLIRKFILKKTSYAQNQGFAVDIPIADLKGYFPSEETGDDDNDEHEGLFISLCDLSTAANPGAFAIAYRKDTIKYDQTKVPFINTFSANLYSTAFITYTPPPPSPPLSDQELNLYIRSFIENTVHSTQTSTITPTVNNRNKFKSLMGSDAVYPWAFFHRNQIYQLINQGGIGNYIRLFLGYENDAGRKNQIHIVLVGVGADGKPMFTSPGPAPLSVKLVLDKAWP